MSLSDFWDNVTTPGFCSNAFDELKQIGRETREEFGELFEEGQELFTVGAKRMLIDGDSDYKTTAEHRADVRRQIIAAEKKMLVARGVNDESDPLLLFACCEMDSMLDWLKDVPELKLRQIGRESEDRFEHLAICRLDELRMLQTYLSALCELPDAPVYRAPEPIGNPICLPLLFHGLSNISVREEATRTYCREVDSYQKLLRQAADGNLDGLRLEHLGKKGQRLLEKVLERLSSQVCSAVTSLRLSTVFAVSLFGPGDSGTDPETANWEKAGELLILLSVFHALVSSVIVRKGEQGDILPPELLEEINCWLKATEPDVDPREDWD